MATQPRSAGARRSGITLLETMLSLSLAVLLLGSVYAAIDQSWRLTASGREEMERAQLARALIHKIGLDIRSITYIAPPPVEDTETTEGTTTNTDANANANAAGATTTDTETETVPNSKSVGLRGTNQQLEISIARPRRDLLPGSGTVATGSPTSDLRQVTYSFGTVGGSTGGLIRTEGDRMAVEVVEAGGATATQISPGQMLAPEVASTAFRYFDGRTWYDAWDSDVMLRIPRAVEISIAFTPPRRAASVFKTNVSRSMDTFRTVIVIPVSDPYPKEFLTQ